MFNKMIEKAVNKSQHCQRNWDLFKPIPEDDIVTMETAVTQCPSKQNYAYYTPYVITDRAIIEKIHDATDGFDINEAGDTVKNSQVQANILFVFVADDEYNRIEGYRELGVKAAKECGYELDEQRKQRQLSVGIAAGYLNLSATLLGYSTGCCSCFNNDTIQEILGVDKEIMLLMGVGWADKTRPRREMHDDKNFIFPTYSKNLSAIRVA